jgi:anti-anti-sigma factor
MDSTGVAAVRIDWSERGAVMVATVHGDIRGDDADSFHGALLQAVKSRTIRSLVVDMSNVTALGSHAVAALVKAWKTLSDRGASMALVSSKKTVTSVLVNGNLQSLMPVAQSVDVACRGLERQGD